MTITRRRSLGMGATALAGLGLSTIVPFRARAQGMDGDSYPTDSGEIIVHPVDHASFVMTTPGLTIYVDPVGGAALYDGLPPAQFILITHEHGDHYDPGTLEALAGGQTRLLTNPAVYDMLPADLKARATAIANGESTTVDDVAIEAIPAYNLTEDRLQYHPEGRDNGYVLTIDGLRVYIAGDTEDIPEMRALEGIGVAFLPMNLPYTMSVDQAADAVTAFAPTIVYPYHYGESDVQAFAEMVAAAGGATEVVMGAWYG